MVQTRLSSFSVPSLPSPSSSRSSKAVEGNLVDGSRKSMRLQHENPSTNLPPRPPRAPNSSSAKRPPLAASSTSNPKQSIVTDNSPSLHSASTLVPKPSPADHFLRGFNIDSCSDLLSIPDPPSPTLCSKRNKRRESSPILRPLRDLTNSVPSEDAEKKRSRKSLSSFLTPQNDPKGQEEEKWQEAANLDENSQFITRRRKSMSHVPSSRMQVQVALKAEVKSTSVTLPSTQTPQKHAAVERLQTKNLPGYQGSKEEFKLDISEDISSKRRKKRQSMYLPNDDLDGEDNSTELVAVNYQLVAANEYFKSLMSYNNVPKPAKNIPDRIYLPTGEASQEIGAAIKPEVSMAKQDVKPKLVLEMEEIRRLAREYCSLPMTERDSSDQAYQIEALTGYPLIPPASKIRQMSQTDNKRGGLNWSGSPDKESAEESRRSHILSMGPIVHRLDRRKNEDLSLMENKTECRVEKTRNNKYRYVHIVTEQGVDPIYYKECYIAALNGMKSDIRRGIRHFLDQHGQIRGNTTIASGPHRKPEVTAVSEDPSSNSLCSPSRIDYVGYDVILNKVKEESDGGEAMDLDESKMSMDEGMHCGESPRIERVQNHQQPLQDLHDEIELSAPLTGLLLSLPSRDELSSDPEIAAAETKLWNSVDAALEIYSKEVLKIRELRKWQKGSTEFWNPDRRG